MVPCNTYIPLKRADDFENRYRNKGSLLIAAGKFLYGVVLVMVGLSVFKLVGENLSAGLSRLINHWHIDAHLFYVNWLQNKVAHISNHQLVLLAVANFVYAALSFIEATGLAWQRRWANWLVIADTS